MSNAPEWFDELASHYAESRENLNRICADHQQRLEAIAALNDKTWRRVTTNRWAAFTTNELRGIAACIDLHATEYSTAHGYPASGCEHMTDEINAELERRKQRT